MAGTKFSGGRRRLKAESPYGFGQWVLSLAVGLPVMLIVGASLVVGGVIDGVPQLAIYGAFVFGLGLTGGVFLPLELRLLFGRTGPVLGATPEGQSATSVNRAGWHMTQVVVVLLIIAGAPLASGIFLLFDEEYAPLAVFMLPLGLWMASYFVPILRGQVHGGGVYLTPEGVTYVKHGGWWRAGWDDILATTSGEPVRVLLEPGRTGERGRTSRWGWKGEVNTGTPTVLGIETRYLAVGPTALAEVINLCRKEPGLRAQLGTPAALAWPAWKLEELPPQVAAGRPGAQGYSR